MENQEALSRLVRIERKLDRILEMAAGDAGPSDEDVADAVEKFIEDALLPKWLAD
jgi:hypothetical protein